SAPQSLATQCAPLTCHSSGNGDFCKYAATPITALINAAAAPILTVAPIPAAARPVITPPAAPLIPAAVSPLSQIRRCELLPVMIHHYFLDPRFLPTPRSQMAAHARRALRHPSGCMPTPRTRALCALPFRTTCRAVSPSGNASPTRLLAPHAPQSLASTGQTRPSTLAE